MEKDFCQTEATAWLRAYMARRSISVAELAERLKSVRVSITPKVLSTKIERGTFSLYFFIQCLYALDATEFSTDLLPFPEDQRGPGRRT